MEALDVPWQPCDLNEWNSVQVKHAFDICLGKMLQPTQISPDDINLPYLKAKHVQWDTVLTEELPRMWASKKESEQLSLRPGDLLVCEGGDVGRSAILEEDAPEGCIFQNALHRVRAIGNNDVRFLKYCLQQAAEANWFEVLCNRATIAHFTVEKFREFRIHIPEVGTQKIIADYLDRETARIDELMEEKNHMLMLFEEKRTALISRAVTDGLSHDAATSPSGFEWLGEIPKSWKIDRAKNLFAVRDQRSMSGEEELLTVSHITGVTRRSDKQVNMFQAEDKTGYKICYPGDLVINTLWGWMGAMGVSPLEGIVSPDYHVYTSKGELLPEYIDLLCRSKPFVAEVNRWSKGVWSSRLRLYPENFFEIHFPVPPIEEQRAITQELEAIQVKENELIDTLHNSIALAKEYRSALITSAVTGQIPVEEMTA